MPATGSELEPLDVANDRESGLGWTADERKEYGIPPKGPGPHPPSSYGFPLPPKGHPKAEAAARAVLSRAHQGKNFDRKAIARQVARARHILGEPAKRESGKPLTTSVPLREIAADAKTATFIIICEGQGSSGYYPASALADAVAARIFEGAPSHLDHPSTREDRELPERSVKSLAGWFSDTKLVDYVDPERGKVKAIEATFHPQIGREDVLGMLRTCQAYSARYPAKAWLGASINACGESSQAEIDGKPVNRIDKITEVISVDLVTRAGAGGRMIALKESYKMATAATTIDAEKLREAGKAALVELRVKLKESIVKTLGEGVAAIKLTAEQEAALDASLATLDGDVLERAIEAAKPKAKGDEDEGEDDQDDDETREAQNEEDLDEDDMTLDGKSPDELKAVAAGERKRRKEAEKRERAARESARQIRESGSKAAEELRESRIDAALAALAVPETFRPRLRRELVERKALVTDPQIRGYIGEFDQAHIRPVLDGAGVPFRESASGGGKIELTFSGATAYGE